MNMQEIDMIRARMAHPLWMENPVRIVAQIRRNFNCAASRPYAAGLEKYLPGATSTAGRRISIERLCSIKEDEE
jgi:hypothetical protein